MSEAGGKCHKVIAPDPPPLIQNGKIVLQAHHIGWITSGSFAIIAIIVSAWLVCMHLRWYTNKREQRYIVRLLFMVPIYAIISFASYLFWNHSTPLLLIRDAYEAIVLTAFFYLLLMYISPDPEQQRRVFLKQGLSRHADEVAQRKGEKVARWVFPLRFVKWKPSDGLYFLQLMKWGVLQYCIVRPTTTLVAVILDYLGLYCEDSWGLGWGHIYIVIITSISVTIAMYCLIQLYIPISKNLAPCKPLLKLFAIKAVVFLTFWQATFLSLLSMFGVVKDTKFMTAEDINIGIGALLETFEMMIFAFIHIRAFTYKPYRPYHSQRSNQSPPSPTPRLRSLAHAMDFRETFREIWHGCIYLWERVRGKEPTTDIGAKRAAHYESAFGRKRASPSNQQNLGKQINLEDDSDLTRLTRLPHHTPVEIEGALVIEGEKEWLRMDDSYDYDLDYSGRDLGEGLNTHLKREKQQRRSNSRIDQDEAEHLISHERQPSWWRKIYKSSSANNTNTKQNPSPLQKRKPLRRFARDVDYIYESLPPPSLLRSLDDQQHPVINLDNISEFDESGPGLSPVAGYHEHREPHQTYTQVDVPGSITSPSSQDNSRPSFNRKDSMFDRIFAPSAAEAESINTQSPYIEEEIMMRSSRARLTQDMLEGLRSERDLWVETTYPSEAYRPKLLNSREANRSTVEPEFGGIPSSALYFDGSSLQGEYNRPTTVHDPLSQSSIQMSARALSTDIPRPSQRAETRQIINPFTSQPPAIQHITVHMHPLSHAPMRQNHYSRGSRQLHAPSQVIHQPSTAMLSDPSQSHVVRFVNQDIVEEPQSRYQSGKPPASIHPTHSQYDQNYPL